MPPPDKNFFNISGDDTGNIWVNDVWMFKAEEPGIRELSISDVLPPLGPDGQPQYDDALKISGIRRLRVLVERVDGRNCREDAIDINHSEDVTVIVNALYPGRTFCGTIKGESKRCAVRVFSQIGHAKEVDWDYGNHENTRNGFTTEQLLQSQQDQSTLGPVTVRCLQAEPVTFVGSHDGLEYVFPKPDTWYHGIVIFFFRIFIR